jgi:uncharacterized protein (DUF2141 family)
MRVYTYKYLILLLFIGFILNCAKEGTPPGGPVDRIPPEIIRTIPVSGETGVDLHSNIQVWFSERVRTVSVSDAIFISPYPGKNLKFRWSGNKLKIIFPQLLKPERTYVITFGTGIRDLRNNAMQSSYTLAFSTGSILDNGKITGMVYGLKDASGVDVWTYKIENNIEPNPVQMEPDYIVQCGTSGEFTFSYLSPGEYRTFAVKDRVSDRIYQPGEDEIGVSSKNVSISQEKKIPTSPVYFKMTTEDTLSPSLVRGLSVDQNSLILQFDEPIVFKSYSPSDVCQILSVENGNFDKYLSLKNIFYKPMNTMSLYLLTDKQVDGMRYRVVVKEVMDEAGNPVDYEYSETEFSGIGKPDTTLPVLLYANPKDGENFVNIDAPVHIIFSEAIDTVRFKNALTLSDSLGQKVKGRIRWNNLYDVMFLPENELKSRFHYRVSLLGEKISDLAENLLADTVFHFQTLNTDTLSEISGRVYDPDSIINGSIIVTAKHVKDSDINYTTEVHSSGQYRFFNVLPGLYFLECFRDENGDGKYSYGNPFPYKPSERFMVFNDTIKVRSRWPNEGNDLYLIK